jgi:hypothetical protein
MSFKRAPEKGVAARKFSLQYGIHEVTNPALKVADEIDTLAAALCANSLNPASRTVNWWRAALLCINDRYGATTTVLAKSAPPTIFSLWGQPDKTSDLFSEALKVTDTALLTRIRKACRDAAEWTTVLRYWLGQRSDQQRVQIQRPLSGRSMLSITQPKTHASALNALLVAAIHPTRGVASCRLKKFDDMPFHLPASLMPARDQPQLTNTDAVGFEPTRPATQINTLISNIYAARALQPNPRATDEQIFVAEWSLQLPERWVEFGDLPLHFNAACQYETRVPWVKPGEEVLLWKTWHTTCGFKKKEEPLSTNITAFVDCVPATFLNVLDANGVESHDLQVWYRYLAKHAPCDPGGGRARGTWQMMAHATHEHDLARTTTPSQILKKNMFGLPRYIMKKWVTASSSKYVSSTVTNQLPEVIPLLDIGGQSDTDSKRYNRVSSSPSRKRHYLDKTQLEQFDRRGYLIVPIPPDLQATCSARQCVTNLSSFLKVVADDPDIDVTDVKCMQRIEQLPKSKLYWKNDSNPGYHYYTKRMKGEMVTHPINKTQKIGKIWDPFWPTAAGTKGIEPPPDFRLYSQNPQGGGKLIASDSGMGPGSTYSNEPIHLRFQFSDFISDIMQSFYQVDGKDVPLLRVLERFRLKTTSTWGNVHVDIRGDALLPPAVKQRLPSPPKTLKKGKGKGQGQGQETSSTKKSSGRPGFAGVTGQT